MAALVQNKAGEAQSICQQLASAGALIDFGEDERVLCAKKGLATLGPAWVQEPVQTSAVAPMDADAVAAAAKAVADVYMRDPQEGTKPKWLRDALRNSLR
jgi:hypothetical protein